jgi:cytochrome c peroxidase
LRWRWSSVGGILAVPPLMLWLAASGSPDAVSGHADLRTSYQRPADVPAPDDNPHVPAKVELGKLLFFDPLLSGSRTRSCATCHNPGLSWGDGLPLAVGEGQRPLTLRTPTIIAAAFMPRLGWDGKFRDIESVTFGPLLSPSNMNIIEAQVVERLSAIPGYVEAFKAAFGSGEVNRRKVELAVAAFQRALDPGETPFDRWIAGDAQAIDASAQRGFMLFNGKARCAGCHNGYALSDGSFHDIGSAYGTDIGRGRLFPKSQKLQHAFKTPTLRDVMRRAPYMHDGSIATIEAVIDLYDRGGVDRPSRSPLISQLGLSEAEKDDLIAFLHTLSSPPKPFAVPVLPR